jgi:hypothetical protein
MFSEELENLRCRSANLLAALHLKIPSNTRECFRLTDFLTILYNSLSQKLKSKSQGRIWKISALQIDWVAPCSLFLAWNSIVLSYSSPNFTVEQPGVRLYRLKDFRQ